MSNVHLTRRVEKLEAASGPQAGLPSICFQQIVYEDRREPSDAEIERQILDAIASGKARDRDDVGLIQITIVRPAPQPPKPASPRIVIPAVLPIEVDDLVLDDLPEPEPARPNRSDELERIRRRMRAGMLSETTAGEMFLGQWRPDR